MMGRVLIVRVANLPTDLEISRKVAAASTVRAGHCCFPGSRIQEMKRPGTHILTHTHTHTHTTTTTTTGTTTTTRATDHCWHHLHHPHHSTTTNHSIK